MIQSGQGGIGGIGEGSDLPPGGDGGEPEATGSDPRLAAVASEAAVEAPGDRVIELERRVAELERELGEAQARLRAASRRNEVERVLSDAGVVDIETARVMTENILSEMQIDDVAEAVEQLRERKPFLFVERGGVGIASSVMSGAPRGAAAPALDELAESARASGDRSELIRYLQARRVM